MRRDKDGWINIGGFEAAEKQQIGASFLLKRSPLSLSLSLPGRDANNVDPLLVLTEMENDTQLFLDCGVFYTCDTAKIIIYVRASVCVYA